MSNNSIFYRRKPTREQLHWHLKQMRYSGEPGWVNEVAGLKRRPNFCGCNPCGEILLDSHGLCNLTTVNVMAFVKDGKLDEKALLDAQRLSARAGLRMTCRELEMHRWNQVQQRDRLLGCSLTGWQDMVNAVGMTREEQAALLDRLRAAAHIAAEKAATSLGLNAPLLVTTIKPEGTLSLLPTVSSGVHYSHAPYYVRRIRISASDPLCRVCEDLGYPVFPEVGQDPETCRTKVVEFPVKAPAGKVKADVSAIEQLENYKMFMEHYVDHNCCPSPSTCATTSGTRWRTGSGNTGTTWSPSPSSAMTTTSTSFCPTRPSPRRNTRLAPEDARLQPLADLQIRTRGDRTGHRRRRVRQRRLPRAVKAA